MLKEGSRGLWEAVGREKKSKHFLSLSQHGSLLVSEMLAERS